MRFKLKQSNLEFDHQKIAFFDNGRSGPCILFVHGTSQSIETFRPQFENPLLQGFRMVAVSMPGHAPSTPSLAPKIDYSINGLVSIIVKLVDYLGIDDCILVGHSSGGHFVVEAAAYLPKLKGVMAIASPLFGNQESLAQAFLPNPTFPLLFQANHTTEEVESIIEVLVLKGHPFAAEVKKTMQTTDPTFRSIFGEDTVAVNFPDKSATGSNLLCPLAMVHGKKDLLVNLDYMQKLTLPTLWNGDISIIPQAGHFPSQEAPEEFNQLLFNFVNYCQV
jgi:pimeloyl-ACP methyl ester carboxylesterase